MRKLVNPFRQSICPYCHTLFYPGECAIIATTSYPNIEAGDILKAAQTGLLARAFVVPLNSPQYVRAGAVRKCPHCEHELPHNSMAPSYTIAIVDNAGSGKSYYLAACINQLRQDSAMKVIGCTDIIGLGNTDQRFYNDYYVPIFLNKRKIPSAQRATPTEPLIYELVFPDKRVNLLFYDASGEDIADPYQMTSYSHYILNASAIIFLVDPMSLPCVVNALPNLLRKSVPGHIDAAMSLNRVVYTFRQGQGIKPSEKLKMPIAITVSKSDLLEFLIRSSHLPLYLRNDALSGKIDNAQFVLIDQEVRDFLKHCAEQVLLKTSEAFENASFFAVSATGWSRSDEEFPAIEPRRCLDPLLWVLWKLGIITNA